MDVQTTKEPTKIILSNARTKGHEVKSILSNSGADVYVSLDQYNSFMKEDRSKREILLNGFAKEANSILSSINK